MREPTLRQRRAIAAIVVGVVAIGLALWALTYTPVFRADHIRVLGADTVGAESVRRLAGLDTSTNVVHVDTDAAVSRLLADPWIASASIERDLPSTLVVRVVERRPVATIAAGDDAILASDGTVLPATGQPLALPAMHAALGAPDEAQRVAAGSMLAALDPVVSQRVEQITVGQDGVVTMRLRDGVRVEAGVSGAEEAKAVALRAILRWATSGEHELATVDVSAPEAPSATLADGSTVTP
jgi:cell division protein FtsQ